MLKAVLPTGRSVEVSQENDRFLLDQQGMEVDLREVKPGSYHLLLNGQSFAVDVVSTDRVSKKHVLRVNGVNYEVQLKDRFDDLLHEMGMDAGAAARVGDLKAPMPGLVVDVPVSEGQSVAKGDTLVILEAMKMENALKAAADAVVKKIVVKKGQAVDKNQVLIQLG